MWYTLLSPVMYVYPRNVQAVPRAVAQMPGVSLPV